MPITQINAKDFTKVRINLLKRKLQFLYSIRDRLERRLSSINATIDTLKHQIENYENQDQ